MDYRTIIAILDATPAPEGYYLGYTVNHTDVDAAELARADAELKAEWARRAPDYPAPDGGPHVMIELLHLGSGARRVGWVAHADFPADPSALIAALAA